MSAYLCNFLDDHGVKPVQILKQAGMRTAPLFFVSCGERTGIVFKFFSLEAHFTATGLPSQRNQSESFRFKRAAFYQGLKSKVGLAAAKAAALRINLNVQGCSIVAAPMHAPSRTSLLVPLLLSHNLPLPRVH